MFRHLVLGFHSKLMTGLWHQLSYKIKRSFLSITKITGDQHSTRSFYSLIESLVMSTDFIGFGYGTHAFSALDYTLSETIHMGDRSVNSGRMFGNMMVKKSGTVPQKVYQQLTFYVNIFIHQHSKESLSNYFSVNTFWNIGLYIYM